MDRLGLGLVGGLRLGLGVSRLLSVALAAQPASRTRSALDPPHPATLGQRVCVAPRLVFGHSVFGAATDTCQRLCACVCVLLSPIPRDRTEDTPRSHRDTPRLRRDCAEIAPRTHRDTPRSRSRSSSLFFRRVSRSPFPSSASSSTSICPSAICPPAAMSSEYVLLGIENPLLDISAVVKPEFLSKYDLLANNAILAEDKHKPLYAEFVGSYPVEYGAGGAAQNSLRGAQWLLPKNSTVYIGCVGKDAQGALLKEAAAKDGLRTEYLEDETLPTGQCAVLITDHNRSLVTDLQAANAYKIDHLKRPEVWSLVEKARFFYVGGYFLTVSPPSALLIAEHAAQTSKVFTLNLSAPFISQFFTEPLDSLIPYVDILFGNESEAAAFADAHNFGTHDLAEVGLKIAALPKKNGTRARTVVFTHGAKSTVVIHNGKATEYPIIPIAADKIVDTNGAGDAFVGGFLSQLVQGHSLERSVAAGHYLANVIIQRNGSSIPRESHSFKF